MDYKQYQMIAHTAVHILTLFLSLFVFQTFPVSVYYVFESNRLVHQPGQSRFRDRWLKDTIDTKILVMDTVTFWRNILKNSCAQFYLEGTMATTAMNKSNYQ